MNLALTGGIAEGIMKIASGATKIPLYYLSRDTASWSGGDVSITLLNSLSTTAVLTLSGTSGTVQLNDPLSTSNNVNVYPQVIKTSYEFYKYTAVSV